MFRQREKRESSRPNWVKLIGPIIALLLAAPEFFGVLLAIALMLSPIAIPLVIYFRRKKHKKQHQSALTDTTYNPCSREKAFEEERQKRFCFHDDKAVHHVRRGKEIDPWDRPDIDISKYQRKE
jgi:hypothetical protein